MSLVARMTPYWHTVSASSRAKLCYPDGQSNPGKRVGKSTFKFKPSRIGSIRQYLVAIMVIHRAGRAGVFPLSAIHGYQGWVSSTWHIFRESQDLSLWGRGLLRD
jgi:hypothetical protein